MTSFLQICDKCGVSGSGGNMPIFTAIEKHASKGQIALHLGGAISHVTQALTGKQATEGDESFDEGIRDACLRGLFNYDDLPYLKRDDLYCPQWSSDVDGGYCEYDEKHGFAWFDDREQLRLDEWQELPLVRAIFQYLGPDIVRLAEQMQLGSEKKEVRVALREGFSAIIEKTDQISAELVRLGLIAFDREGDFSYVGDNIQLYTTLEELGRAQLGTSGREYVSSVALYRFLIERCKKLRDVYGEGE